MDYSMDLKMSEKFLLGRIQEIEQQILDLTSKNQSVDSILRKNLELNIKLLQDLKSKK